MNLESCSLKGRHMNLVCSCRSLQGRHMNSVGCSSQGHHMTLVFHKPKGRCRCRSMAHAHTRGTHEWLVGRTFRP